MLGAVNSVADGAFPLLPAGTQRAAAAQRLSKHAQSQLPISAGTRCLENRPGSSRLPLPARQTEAKSGLLLPLLLHGRDPSVSGWV